MATRAAAFHAWASGFGIPAHAASSVPVGAKMPYLTYTAGFNGFGDGELAITLDIWTEGSEASANKLAEAIHDSLGLGGAVIGHDGGATWLKRGTPFCQSVTDEPGIRRRRINISAETI